MNIQDIKDAKMRVFKFTSGVRGIVEIPKYKGIITLNNGETIPFYFTASGGNGECTSWYYTDRKEDDGYVYAGLVSEVIEF